MPDKIDKFSDRMLERIELKIRVPVGYLSSAKILRIRNYPLALVRSLQFIYCGVCFI